MTQFFNTLPKDDKTLIEKKIKIQKKNISAIKIQLELFSTKTEETLESSIATYKQKNIKTDECINGYKKCVKELEELLGTPNTPKVLEAFMQEKILSWKEGIQNLENAKLERQKRIFEYVVNLKLRKELGDNATQVLKQQLRAARQTVKDLKATLAQASVNPLIPEIAGCLGRLSR